MLIFNIYLLEDKNNVLSKTSSIIVGSQSQILVNKHFLNSNVNENKMGFFFLVNKFLEKILFCKF